MRPGCSSSLKWELSQPEAVRASTSDPWRHEAQEAMRAVTDLILLRTHRLGDELRKLQKPPESPRDR